MYKDIIRDNNNIKGEDGDIKGHSVYAIETKLVLFKLDCYKFRMLIVILKLTNKITKTHTKK